MNEKELLEWTISNPQLLVLSGSRLYGVEEPEDDFDFVGFTIPPKDYQLGLFDEEGNPYRFIQRDIKKDNEDIRMYGARHFIELAIKSTPRVIEAMFAAKQDIETWGYLRELNDWGRELCGAVGKLISKKTICDYVRFAREELDKSAGGVNPYFGSYHIKNAVAAIRLLDSAKELIETGELSFPCKHRKLYKKIQLQKITERDVEYLFRDREKEVWELHKTSDMKDTPDYDWINDLLAEVLDL